MTMPILKFNSYYAQVLLTLTINFNGQYFRGHCHFLEKYAEFNRIIQKVDNNISSITQMESIRQLFTRIFDQIYTTRLFFSSLNEFIKENENIDENLNICFEIIRKIWIDNQHHSDIVNAYFSSNQFSVFNQVFNCVTKSNIKTHL